jgi:hypothetical protein
MNNNNVLETIKLLEDIKSSPNSKQAIEDFITFMQCYLRSGDEINKILKAISGETKDKNLVKNATALIEKYRNM